MFVDRATERGLDFVHFNGMSGELYFSEMMGSGVALLDFDQDGDLDVYLVQGTMLGADGDVEKATRKPRHPLPMTDRLYRADLEILPDGHIDLRFVDVTETSGIVATGYGMGVATGDIDNDGYPDLYITNAGPNQLWHNQRDGTFLDITEQSGTGDRRWGVSAAFVDYDMDGLLDLYVGNYVEYRLATDKECFSSTGRTDYCGPLAYRAEENRLYRNRGNLDFEDASVASGITSEPPGNSLGVVTGDLNDDGWPDVYVANDQVPNKMWINQRDGTFVDEAILSGTAVNEAGQPEASMGLVLGDFDGDGDDDLFMSHLTQETNTLYLNEGSGMFVDSSRDSGLGHSSWMFTGFGIALFDYDLDGWLDLYIANGAVRLIEELRRAEDPYPIHQKNLLFHGLGGGSFEEVSESAGAVFELSEVGRGVAHGDLDHDGDLDVVLSNNADPARLLTNEGDHDRNWLGLRLVVGDSGQAVAGSRAGVTAGDRVVWRRSITSGSYASANDPRILVGLDKHEGPVDVQVEWASGQRVKLRGLPVNTRLHLAQPGS